MNITDAFLTPNEYSRPAKRLERVMAIVMLQVDQKN